MEKIAYYFDADFEVDLFSNNKPHYKNNRFNHLFEHLLFFIISETVFTKKNYSKEYLAWVEQKKGSRLNLSSNNSYQLIPFMGERFDVELQKKWQNKLELYRYLEALNLLPPDSRFIEKAVDLKIGQLYKDPTSFSGLGHMLYPKDSRKILEALKNSLALIEEPIRERVCDFSSLITKEKTFFYETIIDHNFHFKGCIIDYDFKLPTHLSPSYNRFLSSLKEEIGDYLGVYSVDSYIYKNENQLRLFPACEINMRRTMGYLAVELKKLFAKEFNYFELRIENKLTSKYPREGRSYYRLSPDDNQFQIFIWYGDDKDIVTQTRTLLFT